MSPLGRCGVSDEQPLAERSPEKNSSTGSEPETGLTNVKPAAELSGPQLARAALDAARVNRPVSQRARRRRDQNALDDPARRSGYSGAGADPRDPQPFGAVIGRLIADRGWQRPNAEATVFGSWDRLVGEDIASKCHPVSLRESELTLAAQSTAWATQLRHLIGKILARLRSEVGDGVVTVIRIHGPAGPSWKRGPRSVPGRGPRDTYG